MGFELGSSKVINDIKAPMPGLILEINVKIGQEVKENDTHSNPRGYENGKRFNISRDGVIKSISVEKGEAVDKNKLLIEFDA